MVMSASAETVRPLIRLRGRSYVAFVFSPVVPIADWLAELDATLAGSPGFFIGKPIVLDLSAVDLSPLAITHLIKSIESRNIRVLGLEGVEQGRSIDTRQGAGHGIDRGAEGTINVPGRLAGKDTMRAIDDRREASDSEQGFLVD